jgi:hypothetical protein
MDIVQHRILTEKSKLGVGRYKNETIERLLLICPKAIRFVYYHYESIDFVPSILEKAKIYLKLDKPATNDLRYKDNEHMIYARMTDEERKENLKEWSSKKASQIRGQRQSYYSTKFENMTAKGKLQAINHGKV